MAAAYLQGDGAVGSPTSTLSKAFASNVTVGSLIVVVGMKYTGGSDDPFVAGDCTKSAGTATLGTISLDKTYSKGTGGGGTANWQVVGIFSAVVTAGGSLTMQLSDGASRYWLIGIAEFSGSWDASRVEDATGQGGTDVDGTTAATTSNITTAGAGLMIGGIAVSENYNHPGSITEDAAWSLVYEDENGAVDNCGSMIYRIVSTGTTDAASWTLDADQLGYAAAAVAYKEAAAGGGSYTLTADGGSFTFTGSSAGTLFNRVLSAGSGSFVLTGADALRDLSMVADSASFVLTGSDATLTYNTSSGGTVNGQTLTATLSLIAGSVNAGALVSGSTVSTTLSLLSGSVNAGAAVSGQTVSSTMSLIAGSVNAGSLVSGTTLITDLSLVAGSASAIQNATVDGYVFITNISLIAGNAFTDGTVKVYNRLLFSPVQPLIKPLIEKIINDD